MEIINLFYRALSKLIRIFGFSPLFSLDGEDAILKKYFCDFKKGNFIDIGSNEPIKHSNTFYFYLRNWNGICVDPLPYLKKKYNFYRSRDIFINSGISGNAKTNNDELTYYFYKKFPDCSTFDKKRVSKLKKNFNREPNSITKISIISVKKLLKVSNSLFKNDKDIHLLNIDTEGFEYEICQNFFLEHVFPWVICIEELGYTAENVTSSKIYNLMKNNDYFLASRTFLSSIYIKKDKLKNFPSPYLKELKKVFK
tara:strand:- start:335 stop:1096 length:762 start_codon:yes stop_codon:yes gene_type:complete